MCRVETENSEPVRYTASVMVKARKVDFWVEFAHNDWMISFRKLNFCKVYVSINCEYIARL